MSIAFEQAYQAYVARKQTERQAHLLRLRQELTNSRATVSPGSVSRFTANPHRERRAFG